MDRTRQALHVPVRLVLTGALLVGSAGAAVASDRVGSPPSTASVTVASPSDEDGVVSFVAGPPTLPALPPRTEPAAEEPQPEPDPEPDPAPLPAAVQQPLEGRPGDVPGRTVDSPLPLLDVDAVSATAARVGIPARALAAYASAALLLRDERPSCNLTWITLAGVGYVESHHGTIGSRQLLPEGTPSSPIIGIPLDGGPNVRAIRDTDGGRYDGDTTWDRAVGPMQFIPSTWARWGADGNGDGVADPQHIDDAALAAARYLCASGVDMSASSSWGRAMFSYNRSESYVRHVLSVANAYADRANAG
ncbi:MAG: lytic transglycosylase domain-containing protein [Nitriliruptor sp.]|uniref:lytic transglycosylase domain-containing protein n=1 Tax=Nitriliruptor sp. TaxID=2448056 RepID=UPI00349FDF89